MSPFVSVRNQQKDDRQMQNNVEQPLVFYLLISVDAVYVMCHILVPVPASSLEVWYWTHINFLSKSRDETS